ncbi:hypothetical protein Q73_10355 [Bacillus coahuilensis m2-6]|uniref:bifunctional folylpolyglutamate synthase/dihydrofolate synthase n=1 Tax=Bacillus coahuilensis TaxID=408580 RepID=UPI00075036C1|nr:folylpolyglutamate synthase/dihydrofolate synthase family protein [Bacillus coahuilensis]KUP06980.1 hypothetical protein Q73_10355 [Bacillus coahuilensis m2-6]
MMTYHQAVDWIHSQMKFGIKPGIERMNFMLEQLGNPEHNMRSIHIGGTNGKGSTLSYMREILLTEGYTVGTFTSPFIESFNERISRNGTPISDGEITRLVETVQPVVEKLKATDLGEATEFEIITVMCFYYFGSVHPVDFVLVEVGLGGRLDSTNVIEPLLSVITTIGRDHQQYLGDTLEKIAFEKAGIIKKKTPVVIGVKQDEPKEVIVKKAKEQRSPFYILHHHFTYESNVSHATGETFTYKWGEHILRDLRIDMAGEHQIENSVVALTSLYILQEKGEVILSESAIRNGLQHTKWPGRFEVMSDHPTVILDGAHNIEGIQSLLNTLNSRYKREDVTVVFSALRDKEAADMIDMIKNSYSKMFLTTFAFPRAFSPKELRREGNSLNVEIVEDYERYIEEFLHSDEKDKVLAVTGSLYFISEVRKFFQKIK